MVSAEDLRKPWVADRSPGPLETLVSSALTLSTPDSRPVSKILANPGDGAPRSGSVQVKNRSTLKSWLFKVAK